MADLGYKMFSEGFDHIIPPVLENIDFCLWKARMKSFIQSSNFKMWDVFINDFDFKPKGTGRKKRGIYFP